MQQGKPRTDRDFLRRQLTIIDTRAEMILVELIGLDLGVYLYLGERGEKLTSWINKSEGRLEEVRTAVREITTALGLSRDERGENTHGAV